MVKLVIFDLDGTLVDSLADLADSVNQTLRENGYPERPQENFPKYVGDGTKKLIERALPPHVSESERERIHELFSRRYSLCCLNKTKPYEGIREALAALRGRGIKTAVASNKPDSFSKYIVSSLFDEGDFDIVQGSREDVRKKPAPDILLAIMQSLAVSAENTVMVGDSDVDVLTAKNAGLRCIGCEWGFRGRDELLAAGAERIIKTPLEIAAAVAGM